RPTSASWSRPAPSSARAACRTKTTSPSTSAAGSRRRSPSSGPRRSTTSRVEPMRRGRRWFWLLATVVFTAGGILYFACRVFEDLAAGNAGTVPRRLADELIGAYTALALMPGVAWLARRFPVRRGLLARSVPAHLVGLAAYSIAHTFLLAL